MYTPTLRYVVLLVAVLLYSSQNVGSSAAARVFYVDSAIGSDANNYTLAQSQSTPWLSLTGIASSISSGLVLAPGDQVLFKRGGVYTGGISSFSVAGSATASIYFGAYGDPTLPMPSLKGTQTIDSSSWTLYVLSFTFQSCLLPGTVASRTTLVISAFSFALTSLQGTSNRTTPLATPTT